VPKPYDETMKKFVGANPRDFANWLMPSVRFERVLSTELQSRNLFVDALCHVTSDEEPLLLHLEFQRHIAPDVPERLCTMCWPRVSIV
jgi:hypothetical protein